MTNVDRAFAFAHGRVNLIGEHTDYNGGFVLPTVIPQTTRVDVSKRADDLVTLRSQTVDPGHAHFEYALGKEKKTSRWADYIQGATWLLRERMNFELSGFHADVESDVPMGSGLSSSAALEVSLVKALRELFGLPLTDVQIAQLGQAIENDFVGARVGIMDQMASCLGKADQALFLDTRDLSYEQILLPAGEVRLVVINSGVVHSHVQGHYNQRRADCEKACQILGVKLLREISEVSELKNLPEVVFRRARHIVTENARVLRAVAALKEKDYGALGKLFLASHASMRDDYEISTPEMDRLVEIAMEQEGVWGARLTGGGFGGSIVALTRPGFDQSASAQIIAKYQSEFPSLRATTLVPASPKTQPNHLDL